MEENKQINTIESNIREETLAKKSEEQINKIKQEVQTLVDTSNIEKILVENEANFTYKGLKYKILQPTFEQKQEVNQKRIVKYIALLKDKNSILEKDLIELYKTRGIDIKAMDTQYESLEKDKEDYFLKLGRAVEENKEEKELIIYRDEIKKIVESQQSIMAEKSMLLDSSIESQMNVFYYVYLASMVTQKLDENNNWVKAWDSYEDFIKEKESLINLTVFYVSILSKDEMKYE